MTGGHCKTFVNHYPSPFFSLTIATMLSVRPNILTLLKAPWLLLVLKKQTAPSLALGQSGDLVQNENEHAHCSRRRIKACLLARAPEVSSLNVTVEVQEYRPTF